MSLKVWLPLNGNLNNQGISDVTFINTSSSVIKSNTSGKIGSCFERIDTSSNYLYSSGKVSLGTNLSMFCWINFTSLQSSSNLTGICGTHRHPTNSGMGITIKYASSTTGYLACNTGNGSNRTYVTYYGSTLLSANTWYHVGFTYDGQNIRFYVNGQLDKTQAFTGMYVPDDYFLVFNWAFSGSTGTSVSNYSSPYKLNDVRAYDHTLSPKEVAEIAKGLVLHYKLDRDGFGNDNLLMSTPKSVSQTSYCAYQFNLSENLQADQTYTIQLWDVYVEHSGKSAANLGVDVYWGGGSVRLLYWHGTSYFTNGYANYLVKTFTVTSANASGSGATNLWFNIYNSPSYVEGTLKMSIGRWKLEKGSVATPWVPNFMEPNFNRLNIPVAGTNLLTASQYGMSNWSHTNSNYTTVTQNGGKNTYILKYGVSGVWENVYSPAITVTSGTTYTLSCLYRVRTAFTLRASGDKFGLSVQKAAPTNGNPSGNTIAYILFGNAVTEYVRGSVTFTPDVSTIYLNIPGGYIADGQGSKMVDVDYIKLEEGSIATPWNPDPIIYDSSGYKNNLSIKGSLNYSGVTPRYSTCTQFNGTECLVGTSPGADIRTISLWVKTTKNKSTSQMLFADSGSKLCVSFYSGNIISYFAGSGHSTGSKSILGTSYIENAWNHIVVVKTGDGTRDVYCNCVKLTPTTNDYWSQTTTGILIGNRGDGGNIPFYGYLSDIRAYAKELTEDEIKALYNTPISLANNGTLFAGEFVET